MLKLLLRLNSDLMVSWVFGNSEDLSLLDSTFSDESVNSSFVIHVPDVAFVVVSHVMQ